MSLYDDFDKHRTTEKVAGWSSGIKLLQSQLQLKKAATTQVILVKVSVRNYTRMNFTRFNYKQIIIRKNLLLVKLSIYFYLSKINLIFRSIELRKKCVCVYLFQSINFDKLNIYRSRKENNSEKQRQFWRLLLTWNLKQIEKVREMKNRKPGIPFRSPEQILLRLEANSIGTWLTNTIRCGLTSTRKSLRNYEISETENMTRKMNYANADAIIIPDLKKRRYANILRCFI